MDATNVADVVVVVNEVDAWVRRMMNNLLKLPANDKKHKATIRYQGKKRVSHRTLSSDKATCGNPLPLRVSIDHE
jgi:hypothetical protein